MVKQGPAAGVTALSGTRGPKESDEALGPLIAVAWSGAATGPRIGRRTCHLVGAQSFSVSVDHQLPSR
jgi:hypothetical protein